jgi:hypothetical protein
LQLVAQHGDKTLPPLYSVKGVVKPVLAPNPPASGPIPAQGQSPYVHGLIQQLEIVSATGQLYCLYSQLAHPHCRQEVQARQAQYK